MGILDRSYMRDMKGKLISFSDLMFLM